VQIGVRPEFVRLSAGADGLPVTVRRIEDVGRHKIIRCDVAGVAVNAIAAEGTAISPDMTRLTFDPAAINVYSDDWRVTPKSQAQEAA
jgi:glycerol transport system ATP-binding protein